jgi:hypothetical protein
VKPNVSKLTNDSKVLEKVKETQKDIREIYNELSYEELTKVLNEWLNPDEEDSSEKKEKPVNEFEQKLAEDKAKKEKVQTNNVKNASSQFDDLFNK